MSLHACVRRKLAVQVPPCTAFQPTLLGNMWAQSWGNIYPLLSLSNVDPGYDLTEILKVKNIGPVEMVRFGERFSLSTASGDVSRNVRCSPAPRIGTWCATRARGTSILRTTCASRCASSRVPRIFRRFTMSWGTVYQRAYEALPPLFRNSANDGFHEAIGDAIALFGHAGTI